MYHLDYGIPIRVALFGRKMFLRKFSEKMKESGHERESKNIRTILRTIKNHGFAESNLVWTIGQHTIRMFRLFHAFVSRASCPNAKIPSKFCCLNVPSERL